MTKPDTPSPSRWLRDTLVAWEVLAIVLAVTLVAWLLASRQVAREARARFDSETARMSLILKAKLDDPLLALDTFRGLFDAPQEVDSRTWKAFVSHINVQDRFPGMRGMGFARAVGERGLPAFQDYSRRILGVPVVPRSPREPGGELPTLPILFLEPELPRFREDVLGVELLFEPIRLEAGLQAVRSGRTAVTAPVLLRSSISRGEETHPSVVFYLPVFERDRPVNSREEQRRALRGMVFSSFFTDALLADAFSKGTDLDVMVLDAGLHGQGRPLYDSAAGRGPGARRGWRFERTEQVEVGQRTWLVQYRSAPTFALGLREWAPALVLIGGLAVSGILFGFTRAQMLGRARAEALAKALEDSEDRFRSLADTAACVIILFSDVIEYVNDYALRLLGYAPEEIIGKPFWAAVHPEDQGLIKARGEARLRGEPVPNRYEFRLLCKDGSVRWIDFTAGKIRWGGRTLALATAFDITDRVHAVEERLQLERKMLEAQRLESLGLLAGGIAHDFNNLLGAILGHAALVEDDLPADSPSRGHLQRIRGSAQHAADLSRQMLAYSGRGSFVVEALDLNAHVQSILSLLEVSVPKKVRIDLALAEGLPAIKADAGQLHQAVMILATNAAEAIQGPGRIVLRTRRTMLGPERLARMATGRDLPPGEYVCFEVQDDGKGMDSATVARIFDPFYTTKFTGRGLGLAALQGIVQGHGGAIEVASLPGAGSCFSLYFAAAAAAPAAGVDSGPVAISRIAHGQDRILLAEDEEALLEATQEVLQRAGFEVAACADGGAAVERFAEDPAAFSLAILDLTMPVLDGRECFKRLRALRPDLKVILASGYGSLEAGSQFGEGELAGFLQKPYRSRDLIALVRKVLGQEA